MLLPYIARNFPLLLFVFVWVVTFFMYFFSPYGLHDIQTSTYRLIVVSLLSVILGFIVSTLYWRKGKIYINVPQKLRTTIHFNVSNIKKLILVLSIISIIGIFIQLKILSDIAGGIWEYFKNPISARWLYITTTGKVITGWNLLDSLSNYMFNLIFFASILGGILYVVKSKMRKIAFLPLLLGLVVSGITFQRFFFIKCFSFWIFTIVLVSNLLDHHKQKQIMKTFLKTGIGIFSIFIILSLLLISIRHEFQTGRGESKKIEEYVIKSNYVYIPGNIVTLDKYLLKNEENYYLGGSIFRTILKWLARVGLWKEEKVLIGNYNFQSIGSDLRMNTYTFIRIFYEDFGMIGVVLLSFIWGFIGNYLFQSITTRFSFSKLFLVNFFLLSYFMSFYSFAFINLSLVFYMIAIIGFIEYIFTKPHYYYQTLS